jgi:hypothetical protein
MIRGMNTVTTELNIRGLSSALVLSILALSIFAAPTARAQAPVTDYYARKHYPVPVAAINFPQAQRLTDQQSITIGNWRVVLKPGDPAIYRAMEHHKRLVPWWGIRIHAFCHAIDGGQPRHCYFEFYERGAGDDCFLRVCECIRRPGNASMGAKF